MRKKKSRISSETNFQEVVRHNKEFELENERLRADSQDKNNSLANEKTLMDDFETQLSANEPIRELLTAKNIRYKTELTDEQCGAISVLYHAYRLCLQYQINFDGLKYVLDEYIDFGVAVDRKGRAEYVDAHKSQLLNQQLQQQQQGGQKGQMDNMKM